ncbi:DUF4190 domain-containing protein [Tersicoccus solisilvae]|nr:DUF4190 domain-containing protein [Tersicoccus solisilvae]
MSTPDSPHSATPYAGPNTPAPASAPAPGRGLGIAGFILSLLGPLTVLGLILSIVALIQSRRAGRPNGFAIAGIVIGALGTLILIGLIIIGAVAAGQLAETCQQLGPGTHVKDGITYTCS